MTTATGELQDAQTQWHEWIQLVRAGNEVSLTEANAKDAPFACFSDTLFPSGCAVPA